MPAHGRSWPISAALTVLLRVRYRGSFCRAGSIVGKAVHDPQRTQTGLAESSSALRFVDAGDLGRRSFVPDDKLVRDVVEVLADNLRLRTNSQHVVADTFN